MFSQKFQELEEKIKKTAELVSRLKQEKRELERKLQAAEQKIVELEAEIRRLHYEAERRASVSPMSQPSQTRNDDQPHQEIRRLQERIARESGNYRAYFDLGALYEKLGFYEKAIQEYRKALQINPDFLEATEHLAFLLEKLNRDHEASPLWDRILSLKKRL